MKKRIIIVYVFIFLCISARAADPHIGYIKKIYSQAVKMKDSTYERISYKLLTEQIYGGTGEMYTEIQFYHKLDFQDADNYDAYNRGAQPRLIYVTVDYNIAASSAEHAEYLFDPETQELLFFYHSSDTGYIKTESRMYFKNCEIIRIKKNSGADGTSKDGSFSDQDRGLAAAVLDKAEKYISTFRNIYFLDRVEKWKE